MSNGLPSPDQILKGGSSLPSPNDVLGVKKKPSSELPSQPKEKGTTSATVKTTTQKPSVSSGEKPEGLYTAPGNQLAVFKKAADGWYVDNNRSGNFIKLQKGDVEKRVQALEKDAKKLYDPSYENNVTWQKAEPQQKKKEEPTLEKKMAQEVFKEDFFVTPKENMPSLEQVEFVAKEKTKRDLGESASKEDILATEQKYRQEGTLKLLKREGYDVDVNSDFNDPKVRKALAEYNANEDLKKKSQVKQNTLFDLTDKIITSQKMGYTEEALVPLLRKNFGNYGFEFEETGLGDAITVRYSADGITYTDDLEIDLQSSNPDAEMNKLKTFINNRYLKDSEKAALNNEKLKTKDLIDITSKNPYKYGEYMLSEGEFDNYITSEYRSANSLKVQIDEKINRFQKLSEEYSRTNDENTFSELKSIESDISKDQRNLTYKLAEIEQTENKYKESVGSYILQREKQGNFVGGIFASASKGITAVPRLMFNVGADILPELLPNKGLNPIEYQQMKDEGMTESEIGSVVSSKIKREIGRDLKQGIDNIGSLGTVNEEYFSSVDRNILEQAVFGLTESVGASLSGGGNAVAQGLAFFGMSYNTMADELASKEFDDLSKWEKSAISGVYGLMIGQLEKIGFNMASGQMKSPFMKKFTSTVVKNALKEMPENATVETIDQLVGTSLKNTMQATGVKVVNGALSEGTTEGIQSLSEVSLKNLVNEIHDRKVFEYVPDLTTKKGVVEALESSLYEAAAGAIGGAIMGSFDTYRQSRVNEASDDKFQDMYASLTDDNTLRAVKLNEVIRYKNGEISKEQARSNINEINKTVGTLNKIPAELDVRGKRIAFELLTEKEGLQNKIEGKDKNLVSQEINRITEIDNQLKTISENATKKSTEQQQEGTAEGGVVQRQRVDEGQPEVGQGEGPVGQATQQGADLSNRPIEGRSVEEEKIATISDELKNINDENELARLYNQEVMTQSSVDPKEMAIRDALKKIKRSSYIEFGDPNNITSSMAKTYFNNDGSGIDQVAQEASMAFTGYQNEDAITPEDIVQYINKYPTGFNPETPKGNPTLRAINERYIELTGKGLNSRIAKIKAQNADKIEDVIQRDAIIVQAIETAGLLKTMDENINDEGFWTVFPGGFTKEEYEAIKKQYNETSREELERISTETEARTNWLTEDDVPSGQVVEGVKEEADEVDQFVASEMLQEKTNLGRVYDYLDKLDKTLDETLDPNNLNDITRVLPAAIMKVVIKALKVSVKAGMTLEQAIVDYAQKNNMDEKQITDSLYSMTDYQNRKTRERITGQKQPAVKISKEAKEAKEISKKKVTKVTVNEMTALKNQLRLEAKAAREAQVDLKRKQRMIIAAVNNMKRQGTITANQASVLAKKIVYLNVDNPVMVDRFLQYAERLFKNAEYQNTLTKAFKLRKSIKTFMKNNQANVVAMAKDFNRINPAMVEDIDAYLSNAEKVLNAVRRSKDNTDFPIKNAADIDAINTYSEDILEKQEEQLKNEKLKEYQDLVDQGVIDGTMTLKEINEVIKTIEEEGITDRDKKETELRRFLNTRFEMYSTIIKDILRTKVDPSTGEEVEVSEKDRDVLKRLMNVKIDVMSIKNAYTIVESMDNFIVNGITDGLDGAISTYEGEVSAKEARAKGFKAKKLRFFFSPVSGRALYENFATLPVLFDSMFRGVKSGMSIMKMMGFDLLSNGTAKAMNIYNKAINEYGEKFSKKRPNDQAFNTSYNAYERGMLAYLKRTVPGNEKAQKAELDRRIGLVKESINTLNEYGNDDQVKMGKLYQEVFDKLGLSNADITIDKIEANADTINADAVNWWIDQWSKHYSDLYDVSLSVYNTKLGKDINYTTDRYSRVDGERELVDEATGKVGAFALDLGLVSYKDKAGVLMESNKNFKSLDTGKKSTTRFVNLDFDMSNSGSLKSALIDVNTASAIRRVDAFLNSRSYEKLFDKEKDAKLLKRRVENYILRYKNKMSFSDATLGDLDKYLDVVAAIGATRALGGPSQAVLQTVPVFLSTMANAGVRNMDFAGMVSDTDFHSWLNNSGYAIANRGMETSTAIESANKYLDKAPDTKGAAALEYVKRLNEFWLKVFLSQPDVWISRNSWKSYYTQSLKEQGLYNGKIDWTTHKLNKEAADYAQHMVDRQQNVSDAAMMGDFMNSPQPIKKIVRKVVLPFANFIMNQKTRLYSDFRTISNPKTSTNEDLKKAWKSIGGLVTEMTAYNSIAYILKLYVYDAIASSLTGYEDDEEEKEKNERNRKKFVFQNLIKDVFSPLPVTDGVTIQLFNMLADFTQDYTVSKEDIDQAVEERNLYLENRDKDPMTAKEKDEFIKEFVDSQKMVFEEYGSKQWIDLGTATIAFDKAVELYDMIAMTTTGKFKKEFNGNEVEKVMLPEDKSVMGVATAFSTLYNLGLLPREFNSEAMSIKKYVQKKAISEDQLEDYNTIKKETGNVDGYKMDLLKSKMKIDNVLEEIDWIESLGGLTKEQSVEYSKLRKIQGEVYASDIAKIKKGIKAEKIYK